MACVHLVCGFLGVGKTTFSEELARRESAIRFSIDELYLRLFADGPTFDLDPRALERLLDVVNDLWPQLSQAGVAVVLDFGFWRKALRDEVRERARLVGAETHLHWLRCPDESASLAVWRATASRRFSDFRGRVLGLEVAF